MVMKKFWESGKLRTDIYALFPILYLKSCVAYLGCNKWLFELLLPFY